MGAVHLRVKDAVAEITLDNPAKLNALSSDMIGQLEAHCAAIEADRAVRAVVVSAVGDRAFCVGADIKEWSALDPRGFARDWIRRGHRAFDRLARLSAPSVAALSGHAFGGGLELAAACDLRVMRPDAALALPETSIGVVPGWSGTQRLARLLPEAVLKEMALAGAQLSAERAHALGLINRVADDPSAEARTLAAGIAARAPQATEIAKWMISAAAGEDAAAGVDALAGAAMSASAEKTTGVEAFLAKRPPHFRDD